MTLQAAQAQLSNIINSVVAGMSAAQLDQKTDALLALQDSLPAGSEFDVISKAITEMMPKLGGQITQAGLSELQLRASSPETLERIRASTAEFKQLQINQRPAFVLDDRIGDRAVFSGLVSAEPIFATIEAMLRDCDAYQSYVVHHGSPPATAD